MTSRGWALRASEDMVARRALALALAWVLGPLWDWYSRRLARWRPMAG